jgi:hypothetical protein
MSGPTDCESGSVKDRGRGRHFAKKSPHTAKGDARQKRTPGRDLEHRTLARPVAHELSPQGGMPDAMLSYSANASPDVRHAHNSGSFFGRRE